MPENYPKAPITEAIIGLHFSSPPGMNTVEKFAKKQKSDFPKFETIYGVTTQIHIGEQKTQDSKFEIEGYKLTDANAEFTLTIRGQQFVLSKRAPYQDWEQLFDKARKIWTRFKKVAGNYHLARVSTRFVNRIDIPIAGLDHVMLNEYFRFGILLPTEFASIAMSEFAISCRTLDGGNHVENVLRLSTATSQLIDHVSFTLDIDVLSTEEISQSEEALWDRINSLRALKNFLFEAAITEKTRELFR